MPHSHKSDSTTAQYKQILLHSFWFLILSPPMEPSGSAWGQHLAHLTLQFAICMNPVFTLSVSQLNHVIINHLPSAYGYTYDAQLYLSFRPDDTLCQHHILEVVEAWHVYFRCLCLVKVAEHSFSACFCWCKLVRAQGFLN